MATTEEEVLLMKSFQSKFDMIEDKNKCLRVQFLDWLSIKLINFGNKVKEASDRIDSPCVIKFDNKQSSNMTLNTADYLYLPNNSSFIDVKGLKAGKTQEECTYFMYKDRGLVSQAQAELEREQEFNATMKKFDEKLADIKDELNNLKGE